LCWHVGRVLDPPIRSSAEGGSRPALRGLNCPRVAEREVQVLDNP